MPPFTSAPPSTFSSDLLDTAERLCTNGFCGPALVMSQSACELACEQAFSGWLDYRGMADLRCCLRSVVMSFNISNQHTREFYNALTGDAIQQCPFWPDYVAMVHSRNQIVHAGQSADCDEARRYIAVARQVVEHLLDHIPSSDMKPRSAISLAPVADEGSLRPMEVGVAPALEQTIS